MSIDDSFLDNIKSKLGKSITLNLTTSSDLWDLFEAYVFCIVLDAAKKEGAVISYEDVSGKKPSNFFFRTSPGLISSNRHPYTYAIIEFPGKPPLEAHLGVRVTGKSKVLHECDVLVLFRGEANICRRATVSPNSTKAVLAIECKYYTTNLDLNLARSFMGLVTDFSTNVKYFFVSNTSSEQVEKLLAHHKKLWERNITPASTTEVERLRNLFQDVFKNFKAKN